MSRRYKDSRIKKNLKLFEAAERLGISQSTLGAWESERKNPTLDNLVAMADLYEVSVDYLLGRDYPIIEAETPLDHSLLPILHGQPVYSRAHGWALVDSFEKVLITIAGKKVPFNEAGDLYRAVSLYPFFHRSDDEALNKPDLIPGLEVMLEPITADSTIGEQLRGNYTVKEGYVENQAGNRFTLDTYGYRWLAFNDKKKK